MEKPTYIDISPIASHSASSVATAQPGGHVSPRVRHCAGDIPPILSPLDAFVAESRRLAKELEATRIAGERRMSRLPPAVITKSLSQHQANRPQCFRTLSGNLSTDSMSPGPLPETFVQGTSPELTTPQKRPQSSYPQLHAHPHHDSQTAPQNTFSADQPQLDYFALRRTQSPVNMASPPSRTNTADRLNPSWQHSRSTGLAPPSAAFTRKYQESSDDDYTSSNAGSTFSIIPRKTSVGSGMSFSTSPALKSHDRSSSTLSEESTASHQKSKARYNFSRPLSQTSLRDQATSPTRARLIGQTRDIHSSEEVTSTAMDSPQTSQLPPDPFSFDFGHGRPPAINEEPSRPASSRTMPDLDRGSGKALRKPSSSALAHASSFDHICLPTLPTIPGSVSEYQSIRSLAPSEQSGASTIRPSTARTNTNATNYQALSADEHVEKAIELHQHGDLKESTYHFRIAAKQNHPTGMLLFALATRHGWGMRANPTEGVRLLRQAVEIAMQEVTEDESPKSATEPIDKKNHKAQFALAIYELGMSHMKGWGVEQDQALALRCFEIAASWGDADAMSEAGFCYTEGLGTKKDLKKAARFYREAGKRGVSMVGNSWIYKDKYNDDLDQDKRHRARGFKKSVGSEEKDQERKPRDQGKTRSFFGRKRSATTSSTVVP